MIELVEKSDEVEAGSGHEVVDLIKRSLPFVETDEGRFDKDHVGLSEGDRGAKEYLLAEPLNVDLKKDLSFEIHVWKEGVEFVNLDLDIRSACGPGERIRVRGRHVENGGGWTESTPVDGDGALFVADSAAKSLESRDPHHAASHGFETVRKWLERVDSGVGENMVSGLGKLTDISPDINDGRETDLT